MSGGCLTKGKIWGTSTGAGTSQEQAGTSQPFAASETNVSGPGGVSQGSQAHKSASTFRTEEAHRHRHPQPLDGDSKQSLQGDAPETSNKEQHGPTSYLQAPTHRWIPDPYFPGGPGGPTGERRNAICDETLREYWATNPHNEEPGPYEQSRADDASNHNSETVNSNAATELRQAHARRGRRGAETYGNAPSGMASIERVLGDESDTEGANGYSSIGAFWNNSNPRKHGRHG